MKNLFVGIIIADKSNFDFVVAFNVLALNPNSPLVLIIGKPSTDSTNISNYAKIQTFIKNIDQTQIMVF